MVKVAPSKAFEKETRHLDVQQRRKLEAQVRKILDNPQIGKPLKYRRHERALYVKRFRLVYAIRGDEVVLLKFEHRKRVYK